MNVTSPVDGDTLIEGDIITIVAEASDDGRVVRVDFLVDGNVVTSDTTDPLAFAFEVPVGVASLSFGARAVDTNNNVGTAAAVLVNVIPDPLTTVVGQVIDADGVAAEGASVATVGGFSGVTGIAPCFEFDRSIPSGVMTLAAELVDFAVGLLLLQLAFVIADVDLFAALVRVVDRALHAQNAKVALG